MRVRILNSNTHVGQGLREGGLQRCADELDADIVTVQEVNRQLLRYRLRRQFPRADWGIWGLMPPSVGPSSAGNHVLWKKDLFHSISGNRDFISPQLFIDNQRDKWHPSRRHAQVLLKANGKPDLRIAVQSDHTWTTAGHDWSKPDRVIAGHKHQCRAHAETAWFAKSHHYSVVCCGDYNAVVAPGDSHEAYIEQQMRTHGMVPARPKTATRPSLDAAFISPDVEVVSFDWIPKHLLTTDHDGFLLVVNIREQ